MSEIEKLGKCEKNRNNESFVPEPFDLKECVPHLFSTMTLQMIMPMSHLPRLIYNKYGECIVHYDAIKEKNSQVTLSIFKDNPYITKFVGNDYTIHNSMPVRHVRNDSANIVHEWSRVYGFDDDSTRKPEIYLNGPNPYFEELGEGKKINIAVFNKDGWGLSAWNKIYQNKNEEDLLIKDIFTIIKNKFSNYDISFYKIGSRGGDLGLIQRCGQHNGVRGLMHFLEMCDLYIGSGDTGIMPAATALGIKCVILAKQFHAGSIVGTWCYPENIHILTRRPNDKFNCSCDGLVAENQKDLTDLLVQIIEKQIILKFEKLTNNHK